MIQAVLFDLDETLLDLDLDAYIRSYAAQRLNLLSFIGRTSPIRIAVPYWRATVSMLGRREDALTNAAFFARRFEELSGIPVDDPDIADCLDWYDREVFNPAAFTSPTIGARPRHGALACLEACRASGVKVALATNPSFPSTCTFERMRWAGIDGFPFDHVSTMENSTRAKPWAPYYRGVCDALGVDPAACLMVGNDPRNDFARDGLPLRTCYVGRAPVPAAAVWSGDTAALARALPALIDAG